MIGPALGLVFVLVALPAVFFGTHRRAIVALVIGLVFLGVAVWRRWGKGVASGALIDVDGTRVHIDPASRFIAPRDLPLGGVDYFAAETEIETIINQQRHVEVETSRWYAVHVHLKTGEKQPIASFAERDHALFVAQRLDALIERACAVRGVLRNARPIVPVPYR
jgi:hypothetical protein